MKVNYNKELLEKAVKNNYSYAGVCREIGLKPVGGNYKTIKSKIQLYNLDTSHFTGQRWNKGESHTEKTCRYSLNDVLQEGIIYSSDSLRKRLIKENLKKNECECCHISGDEIPLELHHINGNHNDNRLENLQILCPNCHSKTPNFRNREGKNNAEERRLTVEKNHLAVCEYCGKEFYSDRLDKKRRFCCREHYVQYCRNLENSENISEEFIKDKMKQCSDITTLGKLLGKSRTTARNYLIKYNLYEEFKSKYDFHAKPVLQYDIHNNLIKEWPSITDAEETLHLFSISDCCQFKRKSCGGYIWRYAK